MRPLLLLLLCAQSVVSSLTSNLSPNLWNRNSGVAYYTIFPVDATQAVETTKTEAALKELCGDTNVIPNKRDNDESSTGVESWTVTSTDVDDLTTTINAIDGVSAVEHNDLSHPSSTSSDRIALAPRDDDDVKIYMATTNETDVKEIEDFLLSKIQGRKEVFPLVLDGELMGWYSLALTSEDAKAVESHKGITGIRVVGKLEMFRALPAGNEPQSSHKPSGIFELANTLTKRAGTWLKQANADQALNMDSQFSGAALDKLTDFVHVPEPGKDTFIYHVEMGAQLDAMNPGFTYEFRPPGDEAKNMKVLQTRNFDPKGSYPWDDCSSRSSKYRKSHGTMVAAKAVGTQFGVAKSATFIPVKISGFEAPEKPSGDPNAPPPKFVAGEADFSVGLELIRAHISETSGQEHRSVVLITSGNGPYTQTQVDSDRIVYAIYKRPIKTLLDLGVPIVVAAGNVNPEFPDEKIINTLPQMLQHKDDMPIINVGAANYEGKRHTTSRYFAPDNKEPLIYAPGYNVKSLPQEGFKFVEDSGTSFAAPQVAGLIATYLSHEPTRKRWEGLRGIPRVQAIVKYLHSDDSSWERAPGNDPDSGKPIRMIWNGAAQEDHHYAGANGYSVPPQDGPTAPTPAQKTKALSIILQKSTIFNPIGSSVSSRWSWRFYATDQGVSVLCEEKVKLLLDRETEKGDPRDNSKHPPYPAGSFPVGKVVDGVDCDYKNDGQGNAGALWCGQRRIECQADSMKDTAKDMKPCDKNGPSISQHAVVFCEW